MTNWNWKDLLTNRDRRQFPEVVVALARGSAPENKDIAIDDSNDSLDKASSQEKGVGGPRAVGSTLSLETLRAEVESDIAASGHDTVYDRMFPSTTKLLLSDLDWLGSCRLRQTCTSI